MRMLYRDWDRFTTRIVPFLRAVLGAEPPDRELVELIGELSLASKRFATWWGASRRQASKHRSDRLLPPASRAARSALHDPAPAGSTPDDHHLPRRPRLTIRPGSPSASQFGKLSADDKRLSHECCLSNTNRTLPSRPVSPCARLTASFQSSSRTVRATRALSVPSPTSATNSR